MRLQKTGIKLDIFTNTENLNGIRNHKNHENWGGVTICNKQDLERILPSIKKSHETMKKAVKENINTGWYALTPKEESEEDTEEEEIADNEFEGYLKEPIIENRPKDY